MTDMILLPASDLRAMIRSEVTRALRAELPPQAETMGVKDMTTHYHVSEPTILA